MPVAKARHLVLPNAELSCEMARRRDSAFVLFLGLAILCHVAKPLLISGRPRSAFFDPCSDILSECQAAIEVAAQEHVAVACPELTQPVHTSFAAHSLDFLSLAAFELSLTLAAADVAHANNKRRMCGRESWRATMLRQHSTLKCLLHIDHHLDGTHRAPRGSLVVGIRGVFSEDVGTKHRLFGILWLYQSMVRKELVRPTTLSVVVAATRVSL